MRRLRLLLEYDGTDFCGFQRQPEGRSVQGELEGALSRLCGEPIQVTGAGRTDAGVHAGGQVIHFDTEGRIPADRLERAASRLLAPEIRVRHVQETRSDFHARYCALRRTYDYRISREPPSPFIARYMLHIEGLAGGAVRRMRGELDLLLGQHDFKPLSTGFPGDRDTVRTLLAAGVEEAGPLLRVRLTADGFLRSMVRVIVGGLLEVAGGRRERGALRRAIGSGTPLNGLAPAPPQGLCLARVEYADGYPPAGADDALEAMLGRVDDGEDFYGKG